MSLDFALKSCSNGIMRFFPLLKRVPIPSFAQFGEPRKFDIHTGLDLHCEEDSLFVAIESGTVIKNAPFTGSKVNSPWWNDTNYLGVLSASGYIVYGEVFSNFQPGDTVVAGQTLGVVKKVLKKYKGTPQTMLHLELYSSIVDEPVEWKLGDEKPAELLDPSILIAEPRLAMDAEIYPEIKTYFLTRARQLLYEDVTLESIEETSYGGLAKWKYSGLDFVSLYIKKSARGKGTFMQEWNQIKIPILTANSCHVVDFLVANSVPHMVFGSLLDKPEYTAIQDLYKDEKAKRSQQFLMNHIDEGMFILKKLGASNEAILAYCLHPIVQNDSDLSKNFRSPELNDCSAPALLLSMEYRAIANSYLSHDEVADVSEIKLSPLQDVNIMLSADKVQNYNDFLKYNQHHPRVKELDGYFKNWLFKLNINGKLWDELTSKINHLDSF